MQPNQMEFEAIGTHWLIQSEEAVNEKIWKLIKLNIHDRIEAFDKSYSRFRSDSLVSQLAKFGGTYKLPADGYKLLHFYEQLYLSTNGQVTPLIGQTLSDAGYDAAYSFNSKTLRPTPHWEDVLSYDEETISANQPAMLDFGAAGKGYLVDIIGELIEHEGVHSYLINAGGDIRHRSRYDKTVTVGLESPIDTTKVIGAVKVLNQSICSSAGNKRKWKGFHHIIDPITQLSPTEIIATWVIAKNTMVADGIATALFFTPPEKLMKKLSFSYAILSNDMQLEYTKDFPVTLL